MTDNVIALGGGTVGSSGLVSDGLVQELEELLERVKSGEVVNACISATDNKGMAFHFIAGRNLGYSLLGAVTITQRDLVELFRTEQD